MLDDTGSWKVYFTELGSLLDFGQAKFTNLEKVEMIYDVGDNEIVILGSNHGEKTGFR